MKMDRSDLPKVQFSLLTAIGMMAIGGLLVYAALQSANASKSAYAQAQAERDDFAKKLQRARSEEADIRLQSAAYTTMKQRGIVGDEQRLTWAELLDDIRSQRRLVEMHYEIAPQQKLSGESGRFAFFASPMKLQLGLLHEEDLTRFISDLRQRASALIQVRSCTVKRAANASDRGTPVNLQADCEIDWVTLREAAGK